MGWELLSHDLGLSFNEIADESYRALPQIPLKLFPYAYLCVQATNAVGLRKLETVTGDIASELTARIIKDGEAGRRAIDIRPHLYATALNIICTFLAGTRLD